MAMIECSNCGGQISDKALKCVHCGIRFKAEEKRVCVECGAVLEDGSAVCSICGCPIEAYRSEADADLQQRDSAKAKEKCHKALIIVISIAIVLLAALLVCIIGIGLHNKKIAEEEALRIRQEKEAEEVAAEEARRRSQEYYQNLLLVTDTMLSGAADAENCCNLIVKVWNNAIWEKEDSETDAYTKQNGHFVKDFNDALDNLFSDPAFCKQLDSIMENQNKVNSIVGELKNPPDEYETAYTALAECYDVYWTFMNVAINPTGSLETFSADFDGADAEFMHCYHVMEFYLQD